MAWLWQVLMERGLWKEKLKGTCRPPKKASKGAGGGGSEQQDQGGGEEGEEGEDRAPTHKGKGCCAERLLAEQPDFASQPCLMEEVVKRRGHLLIFIPKFHAELNFIERYWGRAKKFMRWHCDQSWDSVRPTFKEALGEGNCSLSLIRKYARICWRYMDAYRRGLTGQLADYAVRKAKSHRMVSAALDRQMDLLDVLRREQRERNDAQEQGQQEESETGEEEDEADLTSEDIESTLSRLETISLQPATPPVVSTTPVSVIHEI